MSPFFGRRRCWRRIRVALFAGSSVAPFSFGSDGLSDIEARRSAWVELHSNQDHLKISPSRDPRITKASTCNVEAAFKSRS